MSFFNPTQTNRNYIENYGLDSSTDYGINIYKQIENKVILHVKF